MRLGLRLKILLITVMTPLSLGCVTYVIVHRNVARHVNSSSIHENLEHSAQVFESVLAARARAFEGGAQVIARDPRFFSLLTLGPEQRDTRFIATVRGMANDFNAITQTTLFEVFDRHGRLLASVDSVASTPGARGELVREALHGRQVSGVLVQGHEQFQATAMPVRSDRQVVGVLLLGAEIGAPLARELRSEMRCDVTFVSEQQITGTTLEDPRDRSALLDRLATLDIAPNTDFADLHVLQIKGSGPVFLTLVRRIPHSDPRTPQLYVMQRSYDPESAFLRLMQRDMLVLALLAIVMALVTGLLHSEHVLRPILKLVTGAQEMQRGNYAHRLDVRRKDELGYLAERFEEMRVREQTYVNSLEEVTRLKSEFISIASHELRTPISVIRGYRDLLAAGTLGPLSAQQLQAVEAIEGCLEQLTRIAQNATQVAEMKGERIELEIAPEAVDVLLERAVGAALAGASQRDVKVEIQVQGKFGPARLDGVRMQQAIANLIANGIRFTPDGGRVRVRAFQEGGQLSIEVSDNGLGIPEEKLRHIFASGIVIREALQHHSSSALEFNSAGLGLGLAITRGIVEAHGGTISAQSRPGHGSLFLIRVPMDPAGGELRTAA